MPKFDPYRSSAINRALLASHFSPWHACGTDRASYSTRMKCRLHFRPLSAVCHLAAGNSKRQAVVCQLELLLGVPERGDDYGVPDISIKFTNGREARGKSRVDNLFA